MNFNFISMIFTVLIALNTQAYDQKKLINFDRCLAVGTESGAPEVFCFEDRFARKLDGTGYYMSVPQLDNSSRGILVPGDCYKIGKVSTQMKYGKPVTQLKFPSWTFEIKFTGINRLGERIGEFEAINKDRGSIPVLQFKELNERDSKRYHLGFKSYYPSDLKLTCLPDYKG